jgi:hypothetical protein
MFSSDLYCNTNVSCLTKTLVFCFCFCFLFFLCACLFIPWFDFSAKVGVVRLYVGRPGLQAFVPEFPGPNAYPISHVIKSCYHLLFVGSDRTVVLARFNG